MMDGASVAGGVGVIEAGFRLQGHSLRSPSKENTTHDKSKWSFLDEEDQADRGRGSGVSSDANGTVTVGGDYAKAAHFVVHN